MRIPALPALNVGSEHISRLLDFSTYREITYKFDGNDQPLHNFPKRNSNGLFSFPMYVDVQSSKFKIEQHLTLIYCLLRRRTSQIAHYTLSFLLYYRRRLSAEHLGPGLRSRFSVCYLQRAARICFSNPPVTPVRPRISLQFSSRSPGRNWHFRTSLTAIIIERSRLHVHVTRRAGRVGRIFFFFCPFPAMLPCRTLHMSDIPEERPDRSIHL